MDVYVCTLLFLLKMLPQLSSSNLFATHHL